MPDNEIEIEAVGHVYAQALVNEAQKQNALEEITEDVRGLGTLLQQNPGFKAFVDNLSVGEDEREASLQKIFGGRVHPLTLNVLKSMSRRNRFMFLPAVVKGFEAILKKMTNVEEVRVTSSMFLPNDAIDRIKNALTKSLGKTPELTIMIDPRLLGGITLKIGDTLIDGSVVTQLNKMEAQLKIGGVNQLKTMSVAD